MGAPVTTIVAYDLKFYEKQPKLLPFNLRQFLLCEFPQQF